MTVSRDELPVVPMFPGVDGLPTKNYSFASLGLGSLGCEGDEHVEIDQKALNSLPSIPVFCKPTGALDDPTPSPTPAEPEKTAPEAAQDRPRWALWSDGSLEIVGWAGRVHLGAEEARELQRYLAKMGGQG